MRISAKLYPVEGKVACPRIGDWRDLEDCQRCADVRAVERGEDTVVTIRCAPEVESLSTAIYRVAGV